VIVQHLRHFLKSALAHYTAARAQRQYDASDPENRLVADELERRWNQALDRVREVEASGIVSSRLTLTSM
jgi:hypothetical protein